VKVAERVLDVDSTLTGEKIRMGMDESAIQHIIGVLTDLYSDPELAVIREYSTNALDAHKEAGVTVPIEVTTPTALAPFFRVKDRGIGLDVEDIRNIYSRYGTSTKRDTDEQVGMLGLGCKSALTYSDQFTLVATKNGRTVQVSIGRDEDGGGSMTVVSDEPSDAENGVEVIVPVKRDNDYEAKAKAFFRFWSPGTVLLNGEAPESIIEQADPTWLIPDKLFVFDPAKLDNGAGYSRYRDTYSPGWVVMGNVPYPLPEESGMRNRKYRVVAFVDIGEVNFTPSRESLMLTKRTKETLARIEADVERELANATQKRVENAPTPADAIRLTQEAAAFGVKTEGIQYKGRQVPTKLDRTRKNPPQGHDSLVGEMDSTNSWLVLSLGGGYSRKNGERYRTIPPYGSSRLIFTGYSSKEFTPVKREKIDKWLTQEGIDRPLQIIAVENLSKEERFWLTGTPIHDWEPVQEVKIDRPTTMVGPGWKQRPRGSYELAVGTAPSILAEDIDTSKPILWVRPDERYTRGLPDDGTVIVLPANRRDKFERDFPSAVYWRDHIRKEATDWLTKQDPEKLRAVKFQMSGSADSIRLLDPDKVDDPELAEAIRLAKENVRSLIQGIEQRQAFLGTEWDRYVLRSKSQDPLLKYPLLSGSYSLRSNLDHVYLYLNAAYAA
jgi:hypothetical protein